MTEQYRRITEHYSTSGAFPERLLINGKFIDVDFDPRTSLLDLSRDHLNLTGSKKGCNQGAFGACTVLVDGERIISCLALAVQYVGRKITTIEGIAQDGRPHPLQRAFLDHDGFQCGYCTPGQICSARTRCHAGCWSLSLVLLVAAGLFAQSLNKAENVDMKLDPTNRYIAHINPQAAGYRNTEVEPLYQIVVDRFHGIPGVLKVGRATYTPMQQNNWDLA